MYNNTKKTKGKKDALQKEMLFNKANHSKINIKSATI